MDPWLCKPVPSPTVAPAALTVSEIRSPLPFSRGLLEQAASYSAEQPVLFLLPGVFDGHCFIHF